LTTLSPGDAFGREPVGDQLEGHALGKATPVEPGRYGITYFDLGALTPGEYLVAVNVAQPSWS
jgi:hypothetical protein